MSVEYSSTPVEQLKEKRKDDGSNDYRITIELWSDYHDVFPLLLPFPHRGSDPIEAGLMIAEEIDEAPNTQMEFRRDRIGVTGEYYDQTVMKLLRCHKALRKDSHGDYLNFWNPEYMHYETCFDTIEQQEERLQFYQENASIGIVTPEWIAKHINMTVGELRDFVAQHTDHSKPADKLREGRKTMARTARTTNVWTEYSYSDIGTAYGVSEDRLQQWLDQWVDSTSWKPPRQPSDKSWLKSAQND